MHANTISARTLGTLLWSLWMVALAGGGHCAQSAETGKWLDVSGYRVDTSRATPKQLAAVLPALRHQVGIIESAKLPEKMLSFLHGVPIVIDPDLKGTNGYYGEMDGRPVVRARPAAWPPDRAILLHEFLHAYHHQVLKQPTPPIGRAYAEALRSGSYPPEYRDAYFLSNAREYFAVIGEMFLIGPSFRPPYSCAAVQKAQPEFIQYLAGLFGDHDCR